MSARDFHRTRITIQVLSEEPIPGEMSVASILHECDYGAYVLAGENWDSEVLSAAQMAEALTHAGSDPGFFMLTEDGEDEPL